MTPQTTRPSLLARVRDLDDHHAWVEFESRYRDLILGYCRRRGLQRSDAEDVRQMVMLNLAQASSRNFEYQPQRSGRFRDYIGPDRDERHPSPTSGVQRAGASSRTRYQRGGRSWRPASEDETSWTTNGRPGMA